MTHAELLTSDERVPLGPVLSLFDDLTAMDPDELLGDWEGGWIRTGHPSEAWLEQLGWAGQRFHGRDEVDPLMRLDRDGVRMASPFLGAASLRRVEYRDVVTATVVYDARPYLDHLRRVGDGIALGMMDHKGAGEPLPFWLRRLGPA